MEKFDLFLILSLIFLDLLGSAMIFPLFSRRIRSLMGTHMHVGLHGSIYAGVQFFSGPFIGSLSDSVGRRILLNITLFCCGIIVILTGLTESVNTILFLRGVFAFFRNTQDLLRAKVSDLERYPRVQADIYAKMSAISGVGCALGPFISGHIDNVNPETGFTRVAFIVGFCYIFASAVSLLLKKSDRIRPIHDTVVTILTNSIYGIFNLDWAKYWNLFLLKILISFAMSLYYTNYIAVMLSEYELGTVYIGYVISFQGVVSTVASLSMSYIFQFYKRDKYYSQRNFHVFIALSIGFIGISLSPNIYHYVWWSIFVVSASTLSKLISLQILLQKSSSSSRGVLLGTFTSIKSLTEVVAPIVCGHITITFDIGAVIYACIVSALVGLVISFKIEFIENKGRLWHRQ